MTVKIRRITLDTEHENQRWYVIEGYVDGCPAVTKRDTINVSALADGSIVLADRINKMKSDISEYYERWQMLQLLPDQL